MRPRVCVRESERERDNERIVRGNEDIRQEMDSVCQSTKVFEISASAREGKRNVVEESLGRRRCGKSKEVGRRGSRVPTASVRRLGRSVGTRRGQQDALAVHAVQGRPRDTVLVREARAKE